MGKKRIYRWKLGILDPVTNEKIIDLKGLTGNQFDVALKELRKKFKQGDIMSMMTSVKHFRKAMAITNRIKGLTDDQVNNEIYDMKEKYKMSDEDLITFNALISTVTSRDIMKKLGKGQEGLVW